MQLHGLTEVFWRNVLGIVDMLCIVWGGSDTSSAVELVGTPVVAVCDSDSLLDAAMSKTNAGLGLHYFLFC